MHVGACTRTLARACAQHTPVGLVIGTVGVVRGTAVGKPALSLVGTAAAHMQEAQQGTVGGAPTCGRCDDLALHAT